MNAPRGGERGAKEPKTLGGGAAAAASGGANESKYKVKRASAAGGERRYARAGGRAGVVREKTRGAPGQRQRWRNPGSPGALGWNRGRKKARCQGNIGEGFRLCSKVIARRGVRGG